MSDFIPTTTTAVISNILSRLPVKSLLRFRCVSKSFNTLISSPSFHLQNLQAQTQTHLLLTHFSFSPNKQIITLDPAHPHPTTLPFPFKTLSGNFFRLVGSSNGLLLLSDDCFSYTYTLILWNPSIRKSLKLPMPNVTYDAYGPYMFALAFAFHKPTNDFKVVRIAYVLGDQSEAYAPPPFVEIYSLETNSWRMVNTASSVDFLMVEYFWSSAVVNESVHWLVYNKNDDGAYRNKVLGLDIGAEVFTHMDLPSQIESVYPLDLSMVEYGDTIAAIWYRHRAAGVDCDRCTIWVMDVYGEASSWSENFVVDVDGGISAALGFGRKGEFYLENFDGYLVSYDPEIDEVTSLGILGGKDSFQVVNYNESLVLLDGGVVDKMETDDDDNDGGGGGRRSQMLDPLVFMMQMLMGGGCPLPRGINNEKQFELAKHSNLHYMWTRAFLHH